MPTLDLQPRHLRVLLDLLRQNVPDAEVWAYGSRVNHTAHETSDLDLVVRNPEQLDAPLENLHRLRDALSESNLPIFVEVLDWARIPEDFHREIQRQPTAVLLPAADVQEFTELAKTATAKPEAKPDAKAEDKSETKSESKPEAK